MSTRSIADELEIRSLVHDAMVTFFSAMLGGWNVFLQGLQSGVVVLDAADADHATGRWFVQEVGQRTEGTNLTIAGVYHDEYRRETGVWLIMRRRYDPLLRSVGGCLLRRKARRVNHSCDPPGRGGHVGRSSNRGAGCDVDLLRHDLMTVGAQRVGGRLQTNLIDIGEHDHTSGADATGGRQPHPACADNYQDLFVTPANGHQSPCPDLAMILGRARQAPRQVVPRRYRGRYGHP